MSNVKKIISLLLVLVIAIGTAACRNQNQEPVEIQSKAAAIVIGNRTNSVHIDFDRSNNSPNANLIENISTSLNEVFTSFGSAYAVRIDGNPTVIHSDFLAEPSVRISAAKHIQMAISKTSVFLESVEAASQAVVVEADVLKAIRVAADCLVDIDTRDKRLIIIDSGLPSTGELSFLSTNIMESPEVIVRQLSAMHAIPNLEGVSITWYGLGNVADGQCEPSSECLYNLKAIWEQILQAGGGEVSIKAIPVSSTPRSGETSLPTVTPIPIPTNSIDDGGIYRFENVNFMPDSPVLIDPIKAKEDLCSVIDIMNQNTSLRVTVTGSCASVGDGKALSLERAAAVKEIMVESGVDSERITAMGIGRTPCKPLRVNDLDRYGNLIESQAEKNRTVFIYDTDSLLARQVLEIVPNDEIAA